MKSLIAKLRGLLGLHRRMRFEDLPEPGSIVVDLEGNWTIVAYRFKKFDTMGVMLADKLNGSKVAFAKDFEMGMLKVSNTKKSYGLSNFFQ